MLCICLNINFVCENLLYFNLSRFCNKFVIWRRKIKDDLSFKKFRLKSATTASDFKGEQIIWFKKFNIFLFCKVYTKITYPLSSLIP